LGLVISVFLHVAILGCTLFAFVSQRQLRTPEPEVVAVGMVTPSEVTKMSRGVKTAKLADTEAKASPKGEEAKKEAPKTRPVPATPPPPAPEAKAEEKSDPVAQMLKEAKQPPPPPPAAPPRPADAKKADAAPPPPEKLEADALQAAEQRKLEEKRAADQKRAEEQKRAAERRQAEKRKRDEEKRAQEAASKKKRDDERKGREAQSKRKEKSFDDHMRELAELNKVRDKGAPPPPSAPPDQPTKTKGPALGAPDGRDRQLTASELAMISQMIKSCMKANWTVLSGGASARETLVKIRLQFNPNGTLSRPPEIMNPQSVPYFVAISESAVRAVQKCAPFDLPPAKYDYWKDIVLNFQPRDMY
jgi:colicin import membrane protein